MKIKLLLPVHRVLVTPGPPQLKTADGLQFHQGDYTEGYHTDH